jgi:drug/metabolite transporter (DMT)-like permease
MSRKGFLLFIAAGLAWGVPYLFIRVAVEDFSTPTIVFSRVLVGALVLVPLAIHRKSLLPALKAWRWVLAFAVIEMVGPWWLLTEGEREINSGLAGLLIAIVPFFGLLIAYFYQGDKSVKHPKTIGGLLVGFIGVFLLVGIDSFAGHISLPHVGMIFLAAVGYSIAPVIAVTKMRDVPTIGVVALSMVMVAVVYAVPALIALPAEIAAGPSTASWLSLLGLGVICSAFAFVVFFALFKEIGSGRATMITYVNMAVAILLGILVLGEPLTPGILIGFPLVLVGAYFATVKHEVSAH